MAVRCALLARLIGGNQMFEYILGGVVAVIILIYLLYALMRPENL